MDEQNALASEQVDTKKVVDYLFEIGHLKRVKRAGWWLTGINEPESVAEHSFRVTIIGYILASLHKADVYKTMALCLFHDTHEARINDAHTILSRYVNWKEVEARAQEDILQQLPLLISDDLKELQDEFRQRKTLESKIARDADLLECIFQAREYQADGFNDVLSFIHNCTDALITDTAKSIAQTCINTAPKEWWQRLDPGRENH